MILKIAAFVVPLGFDTLAVAVILGLRGLGPLRPAIVFALFEAIMPLFGLLLGRYVDAQFEKPAVIAGGIVLLSVAAYMFKEALEDGDEGDGLSFASPRLAMLAGFGISMDELAIGFPMGTSGLPVPATLASIGVQAFIVTLVGVAVGARIGEPFGRRTSRAASVAAAAAFALLGIYLIAQRFVPGLPQA